MLTSREQKIWSDIEEWEQHLYNYEPNDLENTYHKWLEIGFASLPENLKDRFFEQLDTSMFHLHSLLNNSQMQSDARDRLLASARVFDSSINQIEEINRLSIDQLHYMASQFVTRHRLYSFVQGGASGSGGLVAVGADVPAMAVINIRSVQLISLSYGYDVMTPSNMMIALKVFHAATLPTRLRAEAWGNLLEELHSKEEYFYIGSEQLTNELWLQEPLNQLVKGLMIQLFRKKEVSGIPLISMTIGAMTNYQLTRKVTTFAEKFYQYRFLHDKREGQNEFRGA